MEAVEVMQKGDPSAAGEVARNLCRQWRSHRGGGGGASPGPSSLRAKYLPAQVSAEELRAAVRAAIAGGASTIGAVMGKVMPQFKGRRRG